MKLVGFLISYLLVWVTGLFFGNVIEGFVEFLGHDMPDWSWLRIGNVIVWLWVLISAFRATFKIADDD